MGPAVDCKTGLFDPQSEKTSLKIGIPEEDQILCCQLQHVMQQNRLSGPSGWLPCWWRCCLHLCSCRAALPAALCSGHTLTCSLPCQGSWLIHHTSITHHIIPASCPTHRAGECGLQVWSCLETCHGGQ